MAEVKTITINGKTYTVDDSDSVSFGVDQNLTDDQKTQARANIGAASADVIGDIEAALDAIIAIQEELIGGKTITFTIVGISECTAKEGMTWGEWVESEYNTIGCTVDEVFVPDCVTWNGFCIGFFNADESFVAVHLNDVIIADYNYVY